MAAIKRTKGSAKRAQRASRTSEQSRDRSPRRSPCPVACTLDLLGDRWTLLVIRDLSLGRTRFRDFLASPEGIPTNILTERLERLQAAGLVERINAEDGSGRHAYRLTEKGRSLTPLLRTLRDWGLRWLEGTRALLGEGTR
jgi:DNA-binding HxlR family transcriptional regulator